MRVTGSSLAGLLLGSIVTWEAVADTEEAAGGVLAGCAGLRTELSEALKDKENLMARLTAESGESAKKLAEYDTAYKQLKDLSSACDANLVQAQSSLASCEAAKQQSKQAAELETRLAAMTQERDSLSTENLNIVQKNHALAADVAVKGSELEAALATSRQLESQLNSLKSASAGAEEALDTCSSERSELQTKLGAIRVEHGRQLRDLEQLASETSALKKQLSDLTGKIYTAAQFWTHVEHSKTVGWAFLGFARNRLVKLIGEDTYKLINLQARIWYKKSVHTVYEPVSRSIQMYYARYASGHVARAMVHVRSQLASPMKTLQEQFGKAVGFIAAYMDGVVNNLASVNPAVKDLFPTSFYDRCYAFAFISLVFYFSSEFVQYVFGIVWTTLIGSRRRKTKSNTASTSATKKKIAVGKSNASTNKGKSSKTPSGKS